MVEEAILSAVGELPERRVLVLASKAAGQAPSQRFRFEQWAPHLSEDHGIELDLLPFESPALSETLYRSGHFTRKAGLMLVDFVRRAAAVSRARHYDAVLVHREASLLGPAIYERLIARSGIPVIFDFDDSVWSAAQEQNNGIFSRLHFFGKTRTLCRIASAVTPGNEFLASYARQFNDRVFVTPTSIDLDSYPIVAEPVAGDRFIVCWTGSTSTLAHFERARAPLELLARRIPLTVKVICNQPPAEPIAGAQFEFVPWSKQDEAHEVGACHVGIMPLPDNEATRGKCGLKALQFMATGRPTVVSPVGMNIDLIQHGENGLLATTDDEYVEALLGLSKSPERRRDIGLKARRTIEQGYSARAVASRFAAVVRSLTESGDRSAD